MSHDQMSVLSQRSLQYISPSYPKVRSPHNFISQLSLILQIPGAAASIDRGILDSSLAVINSAQPGSLGLLLHALTGRNVKVGKKGSARWLRKSTLPFSTTILCTRFELISVTIIRFNLYPRNPPFISGTPNATRRNHEPEG